MMTQRLSRDQAVRYSRQTLLPEVGGAGQARLLAARVLVRAGGAPAARTAATYLVAAGVGEVAAKGATVGQVLEDLEQSCPGIKERLCDDSGAVRRFVNIFANDEDIRAMQNLETPVKDGDEVSIVPAIAGGAGPGA